MSSSEVQQWLQHVAVTTGPFGRSLRYTAELVYGCPAGTKEPAEVRHLRKELSGKWGWVFGDRQRKDQATISLGSFVPWEELHKGVQQA
jgi:hypothetical protein